MSCGTDAGKTPGAQADTRILATAQGLVGASRLAKSGNQD
jgi:hypothetical protein